MLAPRKMLAGDTPLIAAARHGRAADVTTLLADVFGFNDVNEPNSRNGLTALVAACAKGPHRCCLATSRCER